MHKGKAICLYHSHSHIYKREFKRGLFSLHNLVLRKIYEPESTGDSLLEKLISRLGFFKYSYQTVKPENSCLVKGQKRVSII